MDSTLCCWLQIREFNSEQRAQVTTRTVEFQEGRRSVEMDAALQDSHMSLSDFH